MKVYGEAVLPDDDSQEARDALVQLEQQCRYMVHLALSAVTPLRDRAILEQVKNVEEMTVAATTLHTNVPRYITTLAELAQQREALDSVPIDMAVLDTWFKLGQAYEKWLADFDEHVFPAVNTIKILLPKPE